MAYFTYDTSVIISRRLDFAPKLPGNFRFSSIVLLELTASAKDGSQRKAYEELLLGYQKKELLIVPNADDWLLASKILFWLTQGRRRSSSKLRRLGAGQSQRMALDALLAASARRCKVGVVTENWRDFKLIQRFCNVKVFKASEFF
jgi:predicted nucleic acid-binding protein